MALNPSDSSNLEQLALKGLNRGVETNLSVATGEHAARLDSFTRSTESRSSSNCLPPPCIQCLEAYAAAESRQAQPLLPRQPLQLLLHSIRHLLHRTRCVTDRTCTRDDHTNLLLKMPPDSVSIIIVVM